MPRLLSLSVATVLSFATAQAAPAPAPRASAPLYFPTTVGDTWVETFSGKDRTFVVLTVEEKDGAKVVTYTEGSSCGSRDLNETYVIAVSERGVFDLQDLKFKHDPPICRGR
jgi:hypothetical protein